MEKKNIELKTILLPRGGGSEEEEEKDEDDDIKQIISATMVRKAALESDENSPLDYEEPSPNLLHFMSLVGQSAGTAHTLREILREHHKSYESSKTGKKGGKKTKKQKTKKPISIKKSIYYYKKNGKLKPIYTHKYYHDYGPYSGKKSYLIMREGKDKKSKIIRRLKTKKWWNQKKQKKDSSVSQRIRKRR